MGIEKDTFYHDVFVTALEGGINYWSACRKYKWSTDGGNTPDLKGFVAVVVDYEDVDEPEFLINRDVIQRGCSAIMNEDDLQLADSIKKNIQHAFIDNDCGLIDAGDADVIVQVGLFGEVVYG